MAIKIQADEKKYPHDPGYSPASANDSLNLSDFDKWAIETRIKQENHKWVSNQIFKWIGGIIAAIFVFKVMNG